MTTTLTLQQQQFWFYEQLYPGTGQTVRMFKSSAPLDLAKLTEALASVVARHRGLRTAFYERDGRPMQMVTEHCTVPVEERTDHDPHTAAQAIAVREGETPFDLTCAPLLRAVVVRGAGLDYLILTAHHILVDEWSIHLIMRDLAASYRGEACSTGSDYTAVRGHAFACDGRVCSQGVEVLPRLASLSHLPAATTNLGVLATLRCAPAARDGIRQLAMQVRTSELSVFAFLFATGLARVFAVDAFSLGFIQSGRADASRAQVIGPFSYLSICPFQYPRRRTMHAALRSYRTTYFDAVERQPEATLPPSVAFSQGLGLQEMYSLDAGVTLAPVAVVRPVAPLDLTVELPAAAAWQADGEVTVRYRPSMITPRLLDGILAEVDELASRSHTDAPLERIRAPLRRVRPAFAPALSAQTLVERLAEHARIRPDAPAIYHDEAALTYGELARRVAAFAKVLRTHGVGAGDIVPIVAPRSISWLVAQLGVVAAGAAYCPCDPRWPTQQLTTVFETVCARAIGAPPGVVVDPSRQRLWPGHDDPTAIELSPAPVHAQSAFCVHTTSGTTGSPRAVVITHENMRAFTAEPTGMIGAEPGPILAMANEAFDASALEWMSAVWNAEPLVVVDEETKASARRLTELVRARSIRTMFLTPAHLAVVLRTMPEVLRDLTYLGIGGEKLPGPIAAALPSVTRARVFDLYGPTETTVFSTSSHVVDAAEPRTIGRATRNACVFVLDADLAECEYGVEGELYVAGPQVTAGYFGLSRLTADRYVPCDLGERSGARMYRTGDRGYMRDDDQLVLVGRCDNQVKLRGFRVELSAIDHVAAGVRGVDQCVARLLERDALALYIVGDVELDLLAEALRQALPDYMQPSHIIRLDRLPMTARGKIDLSALPPPASAASTSRDCWPLAQRVLAQVVEGALELSLATPHGDFFEMGATSLSLMRVRHEIEELLGVSLGWRELFLNRTLHGVEQLIRAKLALGDADVLFDRAAAIMSETMSSNG